LAVGKLRSHASKPISDLAKEIVKKWKGAVEKAKLSNGNLSSKGALPVFFSQIHVESPSDRKNSVASTPGTPLTPTGSASKLETRSAKIDGVKGSLGDATRDKCMTLVYDALALDSGARQFFSTSFSHRLIYIFHRPAIELIQKRAQGVENAVYNNLGGTTSDYKAKIRSLFVNLKDKNNPALRESIVSGELSVEKFCKMTSAVWSDLPLVLVFHQGW
jgi:transcription elongation factor S-II